MQAARIVAYSPARPGQRGAQQGRERAHISPSAPARSAQRPRRGPGAAQEQQQRPSAPASPPAPAGAAPPITLSRAISGAAPRPSSVPRLRICLPSIAAGAASPEPARGSWARGPSTRAGRAGWVVAEVSSLPAPPGSPPATPTAVRRPRRMGMRCSTITALPPGAAAEKPAAPRRRRRRRAVQRLRAHARRRAASMPEQGAGPTNRADREGRNDRAPPPPPPPRGARARARRRPRPSPAPAPAARRRAAPAGSPARAAPAPASRHASSPPTHAAPPP